ncbi:hypothetical protein Plhal304r1_c030g0097861 [Plasmopara halstedii]
MLIGNKPFVGTSTSLDQMGTCMLTSLSVDSLMQQFASATLRGMLMVQTSNVCRIMKRNSWLCLAL